MIAKSGGGMEVRMYNDYCPYGMVLQNAGTDYRYGYQGSYAEKDKETDRNAFLRMYDSRIARWLTTDPAGQYWSPYMSMGNNPASKVDPDGGEDGDDDKLPKDPPPCDCPNVTVVSRIHLPINLDNYDTYSIYQNISGLDGVHIELPSSFMLQNNRPAMQILTFDQYANIGRIGPESTVKSLMAISQQNYWNAVGDNIANGPFGAAGMYIGGARGSFYGAAADNIAYSMGGLSNSGYLARGSVPTMETEYSENGLSFNISGRQIRHLQGTVENASNGGGYMNSMADAQAVLDAVHSGKATFLGTNSAGWPVYRLNSITGTNVNNGLGINQPTNVFFIKGTASPSVVPTNPLFKPLN